MSPPPNSRSTTPLRRLFMLHDSEIVGLARRLQSRHHKYLLFMRDVSRHIVEGYMIHRELLRIQAAKDARENGSDPVMCNYAPLQYVDLNINSRLKGAVDRELGEKIIRIFSNFRFLTFVQKN